MAQLRIHPATCTRHSRCPSCLRLATGHSLSPLLTLAPFNTPHLSPPGRANPKCTAALTRCAARMCSSLLRAEHIVTIGSNRPFARGTHRLWQVVVGAWRGLYKIFPRIDPTFQVSFGCGSGCGWMWVRWGTWLSSTGRVWLAAGGRLHRRSLSRQCGDGFPISGHGDPHPLLCSLFWPLVRSFGRAWGCAVMASCVVSAWMVFVCGVLTMVNACGAV